MSRCIHCGQEVDSPNPPSWAHVYRYPGHDLVSRLNRCQSPSVPYGHEAHPDLPCPDWCAGVGRQRRGDPPVLFDPESVGLAG